MIPHVDKAHQVIITLDLLSLLGWLQQHTARIPVSVLRALILIAVCPYCPLSMDN